MAQTRSKTRKLRQNLNDPIANLFEPLLRDLVFQHLTGREVKNVFAVSRDWNEAALQSGKAMTKIQLVIRCYSGRNLRKDLNLLLRSRRPYQNVTLQIHILQDSKFNYEHKMLLLKKLSLKMIELELDFGFHPGFEKEGQLPLDIEFPLLKKLSIPHCTAAVAHKILAVTSEHLKELSTIDVDGFFDVAVPSIKGKLLSLRITDFSPQYNQNLDNFMNFLMEMSSTLQILQIEYCSPEMFEFILTKMPALKSLQVYEFDLQKAPEQISNQSITNLVIAGDPFMSENILKYMPNLESIQIVFGDEDVYEAVLKQAKDIKKLKKIEFIYHCSRSCHRIYEEMMELDSTIPRGIEIICNCKYEN